MVDAKQLMIGDWVQKESDNAYVKILLNAEKIIATDDGRTIIQLTSEDIHPILITEEILKKNNIEWEFYDCYHFEFKNNGAVVTLSGYPYVHELQHALRLVGLDDMADNFKI